LSPVDACAEKKSCLGERRQGEGRAKYLRTGDEGKALRKAIVAKKSPYGVLG